MSSLQHKLSLAESETEKAEGKVKDLKAAADEGDTHKTTGETLSHHLQLRKEPRVAADAVPQAKTWQEKSSYWRRSWTKPKRISRTRRRSQSSRFPQIQGIRKLIGTSLDYAKSMSRQSTLSDRSSGWSKSEMSGNGSMARQSRNTSSPRRSSTRLWLKWRAWWVSPQRPQRRISLTSLV